MKVWELLSQPGKWCKVEIKNSRGAMCLLGAIREVYGSEEAKKDESDNWPWVHDKGIKKVIDKVAMKINSHDSGYITEFASEVVYDFNDSHNQKEVVALCKELDI